MLSLVSDSQEMIDEGTPGESGELSEVDQHPADLGTETFEAEKEQGLDEDFRRRLQDVEAALQKLERGEYRRCEVCGRRIDEDRLEAVPETRFCMDHRRQVEEDQRRDRARELASQPITAGPTPAPTGTASREGSRATAVSTSSTSSCRMSP